MGPRLKTSLSEHASRLCPNKWDSSVTSHDDSGQVYTEVTCAGTSMTADWTRKTKGSTQEHGHFYSLGFGCSTLYDMAMRSCLLNSWDITTETLEEVPETVGQALWNRLIAYQLDSVHLFLAFSSVYPLMIPRKYHVIRSPNLPLPRYLKDLTSLDHHWLTHLILLDVAIPRTALIQLSLMPNLAVLTIGPRVLAPDIGVDDSLLRTWSRSASTAGGFSTLRALALRAQEFVSALVFEYLTVFPALSILAIDFPSSISRQQDRPAGLAHGWEMKTGRELEDWLAVGCDASGNTKWDTISHALFKLGGQEAPPLDPLPTIHLALGGYPGDAVIVNDRAPERSMHVWYRQGQSRMDTAPLATQKSQLPLPLPLPNWSSNNNNSGRTSEASIPPQDLSSSSQTSIPTIVPQKRAPGPVPSLDSSPAPGASSQEEPIPPRNKKSMKSTKPTLRARASRGQEMSESLAEFGS